MPLYYRDDGKPVVEFDPRFELSPFSLFRLLREGRGPVLVDVRAEPLGRTLEGAIALPAAGWQPPAERDVLLFDDDGTRATALARELQEQGHSSVRALFGGLQLYEFSLDPEVVGRDTFLVSLDEQPD